MMEVLTVQAVEWEESKHPRSPAGDQEGGKFTSHRSFSLRSVLDDLRQSSPEGIVISDPHDSRLMIVSALGGAPLQKASSFLGGSVSVKSANNVPAWAAQHTIGGHHPGSCYDMAGKFALSVLGTEEEKDVTLVHGAIGNKETSAMFGHGWIEIGSDIVFDGVNQKFYDKDAYYQELGAVPEQRYSIREASEQMRKKKFFGPWGPTLGITNAPVKRKRRRK